MSSSANYSPFRQLERQYDPVLQVYREPAAEARARQLEAARHQQVLAAGAARLQRNENFFDLLSQIPQPSPQKQPHRNVLRSSASYDIVSNVPPTKAPQQSPAVTSLMQRPYDIVTGQYYRDHEKKTQAEFLQGKLEAVDKYWKTHEFQPLLGKFVDNDKEERAKATEVERREAAEARHNAQLPLSYQIHDKYFHNPAVNLDTSPLPDAHRRRFEIKYFMEKEAKRRSEEAERKRLLGLGVVSIEKITGGSRRDTNPFLTAERSPNSSMYMGKVWARLQSDSQSGVRLGWH